MIETVRPTAPARSPMTRRAAEALRDEIRSLERALGSGAEERGDGADAIRERRDRRRLDQLRELFVASAIVEDADTAVIGRRVTIADEEGETATYDLVLPGDGAPGAGSLSIDSPLGAALEGRRPGERAVVQAPGGPWAIRLLRVA